MKLIRVTVGVGAFILTAAVAGLFAQAPAPGGAAQGAAPGPTSARKAGRAPGQTGTTVCPQGGHGGVVR